MSNSRQLEKALTPAKARFVAAMLTARDIASASETAGIKAKTGYRWAKLPEIEDALKNAASGALEATMRRLVGLGGLALDALRQVLQDENATHHERIRAADIVLSRVLAWAEMVSFEARLKELEVSVNEFTEKGAGENRVGVVPHWAGGEVATGRDAGRSVVSG